MTSDCQAKGEGEDAPSFIKAQPLDKEVVEQTISDMLKKIDDLPPHAMLSGLNHYDLQAILMLISASLRCQ